MLNELIEKYAAEGYEGKYLMRAVFKAAMTIAFFYGKTKEAEYFYMRLNQVELEIK